MLLKLLNWYPVKWKLKWIPDAMFGLSWPNAASSSGTAVSALCTPCTFQHQLSARLIPALAWLHATDKEMVRTGCVHDYHAFCVWWTMLYNLVNHLFNLYCQTIYVKLTLSIRILIALWNASGRSLIIGTITTSSYLSSISFAEFPEGKNRSLYL